ncbi:MAG: ketoacyl-ACP synthase III [Prevotella sp.]|nr:ketoacyl-ACP synthase III [Alistipes senegalensis]MCM1358156.1 ketoacyl-ACP synthase III [Prevotella sp.]MCM1473479.1 ketoacyl-ACP synthase III [Muribaculaceae bacterium]
MKKAKILSVGRYMPERIVTSAEVEEMAHFSKFGVKSGLCRMLTGCETRHYAAKGEYCSDIAAKAGMDALKKAGVLPSEIDALLFCSVTQDFAEPATANVVADKMDVRNAFVFDIKNACNAFLSGVDVADSLIRTGKAETVLVVAGEVFSQWVKYDYESKEELMTLAPVTLSLGDGGGAFLLRASDEQDRGVDKTYFRTYSDSWNHNVVWGGGVMYPRDPSKMYVPGTTKGIVDKQKEIYQSIFPKIKDIFGMTFADADCIIPTQVAKWLINSMAGVFAEQYGLKSADFIEKVVSVVDKYGNVGSGNVPIAAYEAIERGMVHEGSKTFCISVGVGISEGIMSATF